MCAIYGMCGVCHMQCVCGGDVSDVVCTCGDVCHIWYACLWCVSHVVCMWGSVTCGMYGVCHMWYEHTCGGGAHRPTAGSVSQGGLAL